MTGGAVGTSGEIRALAAAMPKVELHVHLEGAVRPATLLQLSRRHGLALPANDETGLAEWFRFRDFDHFIEVYLACSACLREPDDVYRVALDFAEDQARQNVIHSEVHFTVSTHLANGLDGDALAEALGRARDEARERFSVDLRWIPDIVRNAPPERADWTLDWALRHRDRGVVGLGLAGKEVGDEPFVEHFQAAAAAGLHRTVHAGEQRGADAVRSALDRLGAERIGHGIGAAGDAAAVARLVAAGVPLEVCPTSNVRLGVVRSLEDHPVDRFRRAGVPLSLGSDDPSLFGTSLTEEYAACAEAFGWGREALVELAAAAVDQAFLSASERDELRSVYDRRMEAVLGDPAGGRREGGQRWRNR